MLLNAVYKKFSNYVFKGLSLLHGVSGFLKTLGFILPMLEGCRNVQNRWEDTLNFMKLDFLFTEIYKLKKELVALFNSSPEMNTFWKQNPDICPTQEMESSQEVMTLPTLIESHYSHPAKVVLTQNNLSKFYDDLIDKFKAWVDQFQERGSGFDFNSIKSVQDKPILNKYEEDEFQEATECYICGKEFEENNKVREHDHLSGKYRGAACQSCNTKEGKATKLIPVFFHNGSNYDFTF
ncbi:unnamed protein product [Mytilus coruscus]|uniref:C2H2-type domain-containing protein n=1 Tax=Mytilus coruscus TaxID=42192 RepID=A0A6J8ELU5_MYTCO|nr:unnamed protein product [Mytilus coruscus]